jgi:carbon-monoxide dehydrogenase large subunit
VINAVVDALSEYGVRHIDMPASAEKIWSIIQNHGHAGRPLMAAE